MAILQNFLVTPWYNDREFMVKNQLANFYLNNLIKQISKFRLCIPRILGIIQCGSHDVIFFERNLIVLFFLLNQ